MRFYERALPEMLHFRDSGEIMYEVPLFLLSRPSRSLSICTRPRPYRFPYGKSRFATYNSAGRRKGKKKRSERVGLTNNLVKTNRGSQPRISLSLFLFLSAFSLSPPSRLTTFFSALSPFLSLDRPINYRPASSRCWKRPGASVSTRRT